MYCTNKTQQRNQITDFSLSTQCFDYQGKKKKMFTITQTSLLYSIRNIFTTVIMFIIMQLRFMDLYYLTNCGKYMLMIKTKYEQAYQALTKQHFRQLNCYKIVRRT